MSSEDFVSPRQSSTHHNIESISQEESNHATYVCNENELYDDINRSPENVAVNMKTLCILSELNRIFEDRLTDIDSRAKKDSHVKYLTCMDWIEMLKRLINDLLETIGEIEYEASQRIELLERKLETECAVTHTNEVGKLQNDLINLLKFVKRAIENDKWDLSDLNFYTLSPKDIVGQYPNLECSNSVKDVKKLQSELVVKNHEIKKLESERHVFKTELQNKELQINNYIKKIKELENRNWTKSLYKGPLPETIIDKSSSDGQYDTAISELKNLLEKSESQLADSLQQNECLQSELILMKSNNLQGNQTIDNMKALTVEVAEKHDQIQQMRSQLISLEEELKRAQKKLQFKDNVIKELRKECKNISKCYGISTSTNTTPRKFEKKTCYSISLEELNDLNSIQTLTNLVQHCLDDSDETITQSTSASLDTILEVESQKLRINHELEIRYKKTLKRELDELFKIITLNDDQKKRSEIHRNKLEKLVKLLLTDFHKTYTKLNYIRKQLNRLIDSKDSVESDAESGYLSQEDMEPEFSIINSVICNYQSLKKENIELKEDICKLKSEYESCNSVLAEKLMVINTSEGIIKYIGDSLTNMSDRKISSTNCCNFIKANPNHNLDTVHCLNEKLLTVDNLFNQKEEIIEKYENSVDDLKKELQCKRAKITVLEYDIENKNQKISELEEVIYKQMKVIRMVESQRNNFESLVETNVLQNDDVDNYKQLLEAKNKLEIEPRLEFVILYDLLEDNFAEISRLETLKVKIENENLHLKSVLVDYENDLQEIDETLKGALEKEQEFLEKEKDYRKIIDELTAEIVTLSTQVALTEELGINEPMLPFEASFHELESQNDLLQNTIESLQCETVEMKSNLKEKELQLQKLKNQTLSLQKTVEEKNTKYDELRCKYSNLVYVLEQQRIECSCGAAKRIGTDLKQSACTVSKKPNELQHIFEMIDRKDNELKALKENSIQEKYQYQKHIAILENQMKELNFKLSKVKEDLKRRDQELEKGNVKMLEFAQKNGELISKLMKYEDNTCSLDLEEKQLKDVIEKLSTEVDEVKTLRKEREVTLIDDINALRKHADEQTKALIRANEAIVAIEKQANYYRIQNDDLNNENIKLKTENLSLKQDLSVQENLECSLRDELQKTQKELTNTKCDLQRFHTLNEEIENFRKNCNRLKDLNYNLARKYNDLVDEYNKLEEEYRKLLEIKDLMLKELEITRTWQRQQCEQDKLIETKIKKLEEHIETLIEDRKEIIRKFNELHRDTIIINDELESYKDVFSDALSNAHDRLNPNDPDCRPGNVESLIRKIQRVAWRASRTAELWEEASRRRYSD